MNHHCTLIKITNVNHNRTTLSPNNNSINEHRYSTNKNAIYIMERITYSRPSLYNSDNVNKDTAKQCNATKSLHKLPNNGVDKINDNPSRNLKRCN